jgi:ubiquinone biosynthesis protein
VIEPFSFVGALWQFLASILLPIIKPLAPVFTVVGKTLTLPLRQGVPTVYGVVRLAWHLGRCDALFFKRFLPLSWPVKGLMGVWCLVLRSPGIRRKPEGQRLALALQRMGPSFIKLGQTLATRPDLLGSALASDLTTLQDRLPPFPWKEAKLLIEQELGGPVALFYSTFAENPVAAASIAQVHRATTPDGRHVAVKLLRPNIRADFARDITLFTTLARWAHTRIAAAKRLNLPQLASTLATLAEAETDLRIEAGAAAELRENLLSDTGFVVPKVDWERTTSRVLTLEWLDGVRIDDLPALSAQGHSPRLLIERAAGGFFRQVYFNGFFHGDLHPGNLLVLADGRIGLLDFGIMGRLDIPTRLFLAQLLQSLLEGDYKRLADLHLAQNMLPEGVDIGLFSQACRAIGEPLRDQPLENIKVSRLLVQLFEVSERFQVPLQPQLIVLQRSMVAAEGVGRILDAQVNMWAIARPLVKKWLRQQSRPRARLLRVQHGVASLAGQAQQGLLAMQAFSAAAQRLEQHFNRPAQPLHWLWLTIGASIGAGISSAYFLWR